MEIDPTLPQNARQAYPFKRRVRRHKRIESYIGIEHVFCLLACVERSV